MIFSAHSSIPNPIQMRRFGGIEDEAGDDKVVLDLGY